MKNKLILLGTVFAVNLAYSQVGINTDQPAATLDVSGKVTDLTKPDGIISPRVAKSDLISKTGVYSTPQTSAFVYVTDASAASTDAKFTNIDAVGYYYFDGTIWQKMKGSGAVAPVDKWDLNGNAITDGQFLGTTNNQTLQFKYNNLNAGFINNKNTSYGADALPFATSVTGTGNVAFGIEVLKANTTGSNNAAIGNLALVNNTTGIDNVAIGYNTLNTNAVGNFNVAIGNNALSKNEGVNSNNNTAVGNNALANNTISGNNTAVGSNAAAANTVGNLNTAIGKDALAANVSSNSNTAVGASALAKNTFASNTAVGNTAFAANTTGGSNTGIGYRAGLVNTTGSNNVAVGVTSLMGNTTGTRNIAIGQNSLTVSDVASEIVSVGSSSFPSLKNPSGKDYNTALGSDSGKLIASGRNNTFLGGNTFGVSALDYATVIGSGATVAQSNSIVLGRAGFDNVGIGVTAPTNTLHIKPASGANPLRLEGIQTAPSALPILVVDATGIVYKAASDTASRMSPNTEINELKQKIEAQQLQIKALSEKLDALLSKTQF